MDPQVQTSFIPKKPLVGESRGGGGLAMLVAFLLFAVSLAGAGGVLAYSAYLDRAIADKKISLEKAEGAFNVRSIQDLTRLDVRLEQAEQLIQNHVAPSGLFSFLSSATLERVQFTSLSLEINADGSGHLTLRGTADSFSSLALQSDQFGVSKVLRNVIFSDISTDANARVTFLVSADVDHTLLSYAQQAAAQPPSSQ